MRTVQDIIDSKAEASNIIEPGAMVIDALKMLNQVNLSYLVVKDNDEFKGLFCERDYSRNVVLKGRSSRTTNVGEVMTIDLPTVSLSDTIAECMNLMNIHKTRYLLVYDGQDFKGVVTIHDLLRQVLASSESMFDQSVTKILIDNDEGRIF